MQSAYTKCLSESLTNHVGVWIKQKRQISSHRGGNADFGTAVITGKHTINIKLIYNVFAFSSLKLAMLSYHTLFRVNLSFFSFCFS